jgi:hypothetical protein
MLLAWKFLTTALLFALLATRFDSTAFAGWTFAARRRQAAAGPVREATRDPS